MPKMHYKTPKIKKISLDEKIMSKRAHGMLEITKIYFPTNFQAYLMNIGRIITKKPNYNNMQMSFWDKNGLKTHKIAVSWVNRDKNHRYFEEKRAYFVGF